MRMYEINSENSRFKVRESTPPGIPIYHFSVTGVRPSPRMRMVWKISFWMSDARTTLCTAYSVPKEVTVETGSNDEVLKLRVSDGELAVAVLDGGEERIRS